MNDDTHPTGCSCPFCLQMRPAEVAARTGGEQGPSGHELEVAALREQLWISERSRLHAEERLAEASARASTDDALIEELADELARCEPEAVAALRASLDCAIAAVMQARIERDAATRALATAVANAVAEEREACAWVADRIEEYWRRYEYLDDVPAADRLQHRQGANVASGVAAGVRARGIR